MDKEKNKGNEPEAALGEYARELPEGLHSRVMASVRADKARRVEYRRLRITAVLAAAMLCIFAVSSAFLVMPFLRGNMPNMPGAELPNPTETSGVAENNEGMADNATGEQSADPVAPAPPVHNDSAVEGVLPTHRPDADAASNTTCEESSPTESSNTDVDLEPTYAADAKTENEKNGLLLAFVSNSDTGNAALTATVVISGLSSVAAIVLTLVQRRKLRSKGKGKDRKND